MGYDEWGRQLLSNSARNPLPVYHVVSRREGSARCCRVRVDIQSVLEANLHLSVQHIYVNVGASHGTEETQQVWESKPPRVLPSVSKY